MIRYSIVVTLLLLSMACLGAPGQKPPPPDAADLGPVWGPLSQGQCVEDGFRSYSGVLKNAGEEAASLCPQRFRNVMGARFDRPDHCEAGTGFWWVRDRTCSHHSPVQPGRGVDGGVATPMEGYADLHNHLFAHEGFGGGTIFWGKSFGDPAVALAPNSAEYEAAHQAVEGSSAEGGGVLGIFRGHDEEGYPSYRTWPTRHLKTHQQSYVDWLFRAYQGGHRLVVVPAVNNQDMFGRRENPIGWLNALPGWFGFAGTPHPDRTSNDMEALEFQVRAAHELERWLDERHDGDGWLKVTETPEEASAVIASGKMALVLGSEVDHVFNCDLGRRCDEARIDEGLAKFEALGIAVIFPTHHKVTQIGGQARFQVLDTGPLEDCFYATRPCSAIGLTSLGTHLVQEMMRRGMIIDLGHAGARPFAETISLLEAEGYPTMMTHAAAHPLQPNGRAEYSLTYAQLKRIDALGGMVSIHEAPSEYAGIDNTGVDSILGCDAGGAAFTQHYLYTRDAMGGGLNGAAGQIALALDWNGFAGWPGPRFGEEGCSPRLDATGNALPQAAPIAYPFSLPEALLPAALGAVEELPRMDWEGRVWDFNQEGLMHAGLQPDLLEDMRLHGLSEADLESFYRSARGFVEMWRRARDLRVEGDRGALRWIPQSPTDLIDFPYLDRSRLVALAEDLPLCRPRNALAWGVLREGQCERMPSETLEVEDEWDLGEIRNSNSGMCLTVSASSMRVGAALVQQDCTGESAQQWVFQPEGSGLVSMHSNLCPGLSGAGKMIQQTCAGEPRLRFESIGNTFRMRALDGACAGVRDRSLENGEGIVWTDCPPAGRSDFHWEIDGLRDVLHHELLFSTRPNGFAWAPEISDAFPHEVVDGRGKGVCRTLESKPRLGTVGEIGCEVREAPGAESEFISEYERLLSQQVSAFESAGASLDSVGVSARAESS